jgi:hemoglobin-like flavoprotein
MENANDAELMQSSLNIAARRCDDLTPLVYAEFFKVRPDAARFFSTDATINLIGRGRMLSFVLDLLLDSAAGQLYVAEHMQTSAYDHVSLGVFETDLYTDFMSALVTVLSELLADDWSDASAKAWRAHCQALVDCLPNKELAAAATKRH